MLDGSLIQPVPFLVSSAVRAKRALSPIPCFIASQQCYQQGEDPDVLRGRKVHRNLGLQRLFASAQPLALLATPAPNPRSGRPTRVGARYGAVLKARWWGCTVRNRTLLPQLCFAQPLQLLGGTVRFNKPWLASQLAILCHVVFS